MDETDTLGGRDAKTWTTITPLKEDLDAPGTFQPTAPAGFTWVFAGPLQNEEDHYRTAYWGMVNDAGKAGGEE